MVSGAAPTGVAVVNGDSTASVSGTGNTSHVETATQTTKLWYRVKYDGTNRAVRHDILEFSARVLAT